MESQHQRQRTASHGFHRKNFDQNSNSPSINSGFRPNTQQCFPWYVSARRPALHFFLAASLFKKNKIKKNKKKPHVSIASCEKIMKNYNFRVNRVVKRRLYGNQCAAYSTQHCNNTNLIVCLLFTINVCNFYSGRLAAGCDVHLLTTRAPLCCSSSRAPRTSFRPGETLYSFTANPRKTDRASLSRCPLTVRAVLADDVAMVLLRHVDLGERHARQLQAAGRWLAGSSQGRSRLYESAQAMLT